MAPLWLGNYKDSLNKEPKSLGGYHTKFLGVNETPNLKQTLKQLIFPLKPTALSTDATRLAQVGLLTPNEMPRLQICTGQIYRHGMPQVQSINIVQIKFESVSQQNS